MCITEEEFREQRKEAIEVLARFKELEASFNMDSEHVDEKTFKTWKHNDNGHKQKKNYRHVLPSERALEEFFIDEVLDETSDEIIYIF
ncbi:MAG: hypothetical protein PHD21_05900 [Flavobacteriales bacterium]|nr:hypothetical protein [Flavobacteriales bacterium]